MPYELIQLSDAQKAIVLANYATMDLGALVPLVFEGAKPDGRTTEGRSIRAFLAGENLTIITTDVAPIGPIILTDDQKKVIEKMNDRVESTLELARLVFANQGIKQMSQQWRAVYAYRKLVFPEGIKAIEEPVEEEEYTPPKTLTELCRIVNGYVMTGDNRNYYNSMNLKVVEERALRTLMSYLRTYGFKYAATTFIQKIERDLFLSTFIRWTHTKPDLTEIEVDQMVQAASETVNIAQMGREIETVKEYHQTLMDGGEVGADGKKRKYGMTEVEQINGLRTKHDQAKNRLKQLMEALEQVRSKRLDAMKERNASILNLLDEWMKDEQKRKDIIDMGIQEKDEDAREVGRLRDLDELTALISGQSDEEGRA